MVSPIAATLVLAGGHSRRLGQPKAWLDWEGRPLLLRVIERLAPLGAETVLVAARADQRLPPGDYERVDDHVADAGPLAGIARGLERVVEAHGPCRTAIVACDYPFADPAVFRHLAREDAVIALPRHDSRLHPLHAIWNASAGETCGALLDAGVRRVLAAVREIDHRAVDSFPPSIDPARALFNVNAPEDLRAARGEA